MAECIVFEHCEDWEQGLVLRTGTGLPPGGILDWRSRTPTEVVTVFPDRASARAAITRTEHYRLAFGRTDLPERKHCKVVPLRRAPDAAPPGGSGHA